MTRTEKRFVSVLAAIVIVQGLGFGIARLMKDDPDGAGASVPGGMTPEQESEQQFPPPVLVPVSFGPPGNERTLMRFPANTSVTDFPMLDAPQHVPEDGVLPPTKRERTFSYSTNSAGFRGSRDFTPTPASGVFRIGVLGTGVTFGLGVNDDEVFTARLQALLDVDPHHSRTFEVLNFGRPGLCAREAVTFLRYWSSLFRCDLWIVMLGVNDALPCFKVPLRDYAISWQALLNELATLNSQVVVAIEPVNTFYPWLHLYEEYDRVMRQQVANRYPVIDLSSYLDGYERQGGLRLEVAEDRLRIMHYEGGTPHVEFDEEWQRPTLDEPSVPLSVFEYLDQSDLRLRTFITDVHLNEFGHQMVAQALYDVIDSVLHGKVPQVASCQECGVALF